MLVISRIVIILPTIIAIILIALNLTLVINSYWLGVSSQPMHNVGDWARPCVVASVQFEASGHLGRVLTTHLGLCWLHGERDNTRSLLQLHFLGLSLEIVRLH